MCRFGKEQPLNSRLLIQNVETSGQFEIHLRDEKEENSWGVQVFRSITSDSARYGINYSLFARQSVVHKTAARCLTKFRCFERAGSRPGAGPSL